MKTYLKQLHTKPDHHKKRFALLVSGGFTAIMFVTWSIVKFGGAPELATEQTGPVNLAAVEVSEVGIEPIENIWRGVSDSWQSLRGIFSNGQ